LKLWGGESDTGCCSVSDVDDARRVCHQLGIDHVVFNFSDDFDRYVVDPYIADHIEGRTPNPCIECNRHLKFDRLLERSRQLGADLIATGHHARIIERNQVRHVARGADASKDQSYVVNMLDQATLASTWFPVGEMNKDEVRARAVALGLRTADKPDSQDVCFISRSAGRASFLGRRIELHSAPVVDRSGTVVGEIDAVELVTIGQRRGLDLGGASERLFVSEVDVPGRRVVVGPHHELLCDSSPMTQLHWIGAPADGAVLVQTSAHGAVAAAVVNGDALAWSQPHRRIAPGQSLVFYDEANEMVLGWALAT
jgi:tRNA-uridine 2-sulfurtransferase